MYGKIKEYLQRELADIKAAGLYKTERVIASPQRAEIEVAGRSVLNFCANNYLGLSDDERLIEAAKRAMDERGFGMSSVRFICGCQDIHKELERAIADSLRRLLRRQRRRFRTALHGAGRHHLGCAEPRLDHRRRAALEGGALPLRQCRHGGVGGLPQTCAGAALPRDLHRRGLLDGRQCRSVGRDLPPGAAVRRAGDGRRMPLGRRAGRYGARHHGTLRFARRGRHPDRYAGQGFRRRRGRIYDGPPRDHRHAAAAVAALPLLQLAAPCRGATNCTTGWWPTWSISVRG